MKAAAMLEGVAFSLGRATKAHVEAQLRTRDARIEVLETRIAALESRPTVEYRGVFDADANAEYLPGALVTDRGSLFFCHTATRERPPAAGWRLIVKRGEA